jgi:para-nitrobenzyl esterase
MTMFKGLELLGRARPDRRMMLLGTAAAVGLTACNGGSEQAQSDPTSPVANTTYGPVRGTVEDGVAVFKGVRYGATTEGRRFLRPQPPEPWSDPADALAYGATAPQNPGGDGGGLYAAWRRDIPAISEDCLFLNVWTPAVGDGVARPVMVWFHGGGFATGSGSAGVYDGVRMANRGDVVMVTVNHRLNAFGYTYLGDVGGPAFADSGNVGNLDMVLALKWVHDNIAAFGGDPNIVLIMGESGGGSKVSTLMAMPEADGLFHRAVVQSGSTLSVRTTSAAAATAERLLEACGVATAEELQALPMETILTAMDETAGLGFGPVMDNRSLPRQPFTPDAPAISADVPMLIGTTKDEQAILAGAGDASLFDLTWAELPTRLEGRDIDAEAAIAMTRELYPDASPGEVYFVITTEIGMRRNAIIQAERKAEQGVAPAFMYLLTWETPVDGGKWLSPHALDVVFMFDNIAKSDTFIPPENAEEAQPVADAMADAWIAFARNGNPGWEPYTPENRAVMVFDEVSQVVIDPRGEERRFYAGLNS